MKKSQVNVFYVQFAYGGNGGTAMQLPSLANWWAKTYHKMASDERIEHVGVKDICDTPITMSRNLAAKIAKDQGFDFVLFTDSDNEPDLYLGKDPLAKPFWDSSFDFAYERLVRGLPTVVCAPYCGPPPHPTEGGEENVYAFDWESIESGVPEPGFRLRDVSRPDAAQRAGIQKAGAGPTGCILYSVNAFDLMGFPKFKYEWDLSDKTESQKGSTEDCYNTREISMGGWLKHHTDVMFCNWDAWAGHWKPKCVGKPVMIGAQHVSEAYKEAVLNNVNTDERKIDLKAPDDLAAYVAANKHREFEIAEPKQNGLAETNGEVKAIAIKSRMVAGRAVQTIGEQETPVGDLDALTNLVRLIAGNRRDKALRIIEVGSWVGESTLAIEAGLGPAGGMIFCVDHWMGNPNDITGQITDSVGGDRVHDIFLSNIGEKLDKTIKVVREFSVDAAEKLDPQEADMIFIDAAHEYEDVKADIAAWLPHMHPNGIFCGHDYRTGMFPGLDRAVQEAFAGINIITVDGSCIWIVKMQDYLASKRATQLTSSNT